MNYFQFYIVRISTKKGGKVNDRYHAGTHPVGELVSLVRLYTCKGSSKARSLFKGGKE